MVGLVVCTFSIGEMSIVAPSIEIAEDVEDTVPVKVETVAVIVASPAAVPAFKRIDAVPSEMIVADFCVGVPSEAPRYSPPDVGSLPWLGPDMVKVTV